MLLSVSVLSLAAYALGLWSEAARNAAGLGFNERFGVARLAEGFGKVGLGDLPWSGMDPWEYFAVAGMFAALVAGISELKRIPGWLPPAYLTTLVAMGGWVGLWLAIYIPWFIWCLATDPLPMDGEFFAEDLARYMSAGVWLLFLLILSIMAFIKWLSGKKGETNNRNHA
ncbi:hypothetical protein OVA24_03250 [Luteolibacter sp. SL250]|uniref:hypothetical protein n=1 Tax=Luteolibacter sp. SL250 TaxID=2995170 RepID=UPI00226D470B|nr:hypothetical protein [Luteolibacter sp. SL250]WAC20394.1 hypothetical protein OVA24_03250 [Luteolibacter sp. SL250]